MTRRISLEAHLTIEQLDERYRKSKGPVERSRWRFLWLLARGLTAKAIAISLVIPPIGSAASLSATTSWGLTASKTSDAYHDPAASS
jgi:hypothetical protein